MSAAWRVLPEAITPQLRVVVVDRSETGRSTSSGIGGRGIVIPFRRDQKGDFANDTGIALVRSAVVQVLGTACTTDGGVCGELPWRTEFGAQLDLLRLRNLTPALAELAKFRIVEALSRWVKRVRVTSITATRDVAAFQLVISVRYTVLDESGTRVLVDGLQADVNVSR